MGVTSVRFNDNEEKALEYLKKAFHADTSSVIKKALWELYEDLNDRRIVEEFEIREAGGAVEFGTIDDLIK
ncbi:MAG: DUF6290 family protein [Spirochaeta sp.]|nr:DUF6290 family protein [Spirochaeta sp.]